MLSSLLPKSSIIHTAAGEYRVRYSLNSFLYLELCYKGIDELLDKGFENWSVDDVLHLLRAGLCHMPENDKAVSDRRFEFMEPSIAKLGEAVEISDLPLMRIEILSAVLDAFPKHVGDDGSEPDGNRDQHLRTMYVDMIGRPEAEFWDSTYSEIIERAESWLEAKGLKERPITMQMFDD